MSKVLVKYVDGDSSSDTDYIQALYTSTPFELLRVAKQVDYIDIEGECYQYESSKYQTPMNIDCLDVLIIYVDPICV